MKQAGLGFAARRHLVAPDIEASQPFHQLLRDLADGRMAAAAVIISQAVEQSGRRGRQRDFDVQGEGIIGDSGHLTIGTK